MSTHTFVDREPAVAALGEEVAEVFLRHARASDEGALRSMVRAVEQYLVELRWAKTEHPFIDLDLAEDLAATCKALLALVDPTDPRAAALVGGAVRYFLDSDDAEGDMDSAEGLVDDAEVVNYVIAHLGYAIEPIPLGKKETAARG
jgi:hypothetical protein